MSNHELVIQALGWGGTAVLLLSYLVKDRLRLHWIALASCFMKFFYCIDYKVWPLLANWVILIPVHIWAIVNLSGWLKRKDKEK